MAEWKTGLGRIFGGRLDLMEFLEEGKISLRIGWKAGSDGIFGGRLVGLMEGSKQADTGTARGTTNRPCSGPSGSGDDDGDEHCDQNCQHFQRLISHL